MTTLLERPSMGVLIGGRGAIYTRVSTDRQREEGASLHVQLEACQRYCEEHRLLVMGEFRDVQSGLDPSRPQYMAAVELAQAKGIDKLVVWRLDRLGRDAAEYIPLLKQLRQLGVDVVSVTQPGQSEFMMGMLGLMAEEESRQLSVRITASKRRRAKEGKRVGIPPFGFNPEKHPNGGSTLVPNEAAPLVSEMFHRYASGKHSLRDLGRYLTEHGCLKSRNAILYILRNPVYLGIVRYGVNTRSQFHPKEEPVEVEGQHQPLIDRETFDRAQGRLLANKSRRRGGTNPKYLFTSLVFCSGCGNRYVGRTAHGRNGTRRVRYECNRRDGFGDCRAHSVAENRIRGAVIPPIEALLRRLSQEEVRAAVREELLRQQEAVTGETSASKQTLIERREKLEARLSRLEDTYLDGEIGKDRYLTKRDEILGQLGDIKATLAATPQVVTPDLDGLVAIAEGITVADLDAESWRDIVSAMVEKIVISSGDGDGRKAPAEVTVEWKLEYAGLIAS